MADNPLKYGDFVVPDTSVTDLIAQLKELSATYLPMMKAVKDEAASLAASMGKLSGVTTEHRGKLSLAAIEADRLKKAQMELQYSMTKTAAEVSNLKAAADKYNETNKYSAELKAAEKDSLNKLEAQYKANSAALSAMSIEARKNTTEGQTLVASTNSLAAQIKMLKSEISGKVQVEKVDTSETDKLAAAQKKLAFAQSTTAAEIARLNLQTAEQNTLNKINAQIATTVEGSYARLSAEYSKIKITLNSMTQEERENTAAGKAMVDQSNQIYQTMIKLQSATGKHTLSVGNYSKAWDGLGNSASQLVRELPSLAISANMFFLAISNNIPIMVDEINRLKIKNAELNAEGIKTPAVWKSVLKSFMSWNTLIMVGVSLLTIFGKDIVEWVSKLFKGEKALNAAAIAQQSFNEAVREGNKDSQKELVRLRLLYDATQDNTKSIDERKQAVDELQKLYPKYFKDMSDESILAGNASKAYKDLAQSIIQTSLARAAENQIVKNSEKILTIEEKIAKQKSQVFFDQTAYDRAQEKSAADRLKVAKDPSYWQSVVEDARVEGVRLKALNESKAGLDNLTNEMNGYIAANERLSKTVTVASLITKDPKEKKGPKDRTEQINKENLDLIKGQKEAELALLNDETKKQTESALKLLDDEIEMKRQKLINEADSEIAILKNKYENDKDVSEEGKKAINATIVALEQGLTKDLAALLVEREIKKREIEKQGVEQELNNINLRLDAVKSGTEEELNLRVEAIEAQRKLALMKNSLLTKDLRQDEALINAKYDKESLDATNDFWYKKELLEFDSQQALDESEFNLIEQSEKKKRIFRLEQEKARLEEILRLNILYGKALTQTEIETIENIISAIKRELKDAKGFDGVGNYIYEMLGLDSFEDYKDSMNEILQNIKENISSIIDSWVELAQTAVDSADKQVEAAKKIYDGEIEARQKGYASNVTLAQKELDLAKKTQAQALREKAKAQKAQAAIDSVTQASSLITATAQIFSSMSGIPVIGWALAIAAVAAMWGSFAYAKIKANQVTKAQTTSYGEGGYEFLEGGSHASGNDIPIGTTKSGKQRKAEGGETLAIIRKTQTKKYRKILPDVINSLNKGTFEQKYIGSYDSGLSINVSGNSKDLEKDVRAIREQNEKKTYIHNGQLVEVYKNLKTTYK